MKTCTLSLLSVALLAASSMASNLFAQANTVPAGYFTVNINAGSGTAPALSVISFPLQDTATASGQMVGVITSFDSASISNSNGGWTAGALSSTATPYLVQITSGAAAGRTWLISTSTQNTATQLTLDANDASRSNPTTLGIVAGTDTYQIIPADTISSLFGTPGTTGVLGGTSTSNADSVQVLSPANTWISYYYDTGHNWWAKAGSGVNSNTIVIRPDTGVIYYRLANTPLSLVLMGRVPAVQRQAGVNNGGVTFLSTFWPSGLTLGTCKIETTPGWSNSDTVQIFGAAKTWTTYTYNGANWIKVGPNTPAGSVALAAGSAVIITKVETGTGQSAFSQLVPYSL